MFESVQGIEGYGILAMVFFMVLFLIVVIRVLRLSKKEADAFSRIPFSESVKETENNSQQ